MKILVYIHSCNLIFLHIAKTFIKEKTEEKEMDPGSVSNERFHQTGVCIIRIVADIHVDQMR